VGGGVSLPERRSEMAFGASTVVTSPTRVALQGGLFSVLSPQGQGDGKWFNGVSWEQLGCGPVSGIGGAICGPDGTEAETGLPKNFGDEPGLGEASAFTVYGSWKCSPIGHSLEYGRQRATARLLVGEQERVERALWTGDLDNTPNLQDDAEDINTGGAVDVVLAIGLLEDYIATRYGSLGVLHMTRAAAISGLAALALQWDGNRLTTALGTPVVAGGGYPGTAPDTGAAPSAGQSWVYASPALFGYKSDIFYPSSRPGDTLDRGTNDFYAVAERNYLLAYDDCGVGAIRMIMGVL
jgi:hypothetical protein